jgi:hypothetical protein
MIFIFWVVNMVVVDRVAESCSDVEIVLISDESLVEIGVDVEL